MFTFKNPVMASVLVMLLISTSGCRYKQYAFWNIQPDATDDPSSRLGLGSETTRGVLSFDEAPSFNYGTRSLRATIQHEFKVSFRGKQAAQKVVPDELKPPFAFKGGKYPGAGGNCGTTIDGNCSLVITFQPLTNEEFHTTFNLNYFDGKSLQIATIQFNGEGTNAPTLEFEDTPKFDFGAVGIGSTVIKSLNVRYFGIAPAVHVGGQGITGAIRFKGSTGQFPGDSGTCRDPVDRDCKVDITFSPATEGNFSQILRMNYNDGGADKTAILRVTGSGFIAPPLPTPAILAITGASTDFGPRLVGGVSASLTFNVRNNGQLPATSVVPEPILFASGMFLYNDGFPGVGGTCGASIAPGASCTIVVMFSPTSTVVFNDTIKIKYNDGTTVQIASLDIEGRGANPAILTIRDVLESTTVHDFGRFSLRFPTNATFTVSNPATSLDATAVSVQSLAPPFNVASTTCDATIESGTSCTVIVSFAPLVVGPVSPTFLTVNYSGGTISQALIELQGQGDAAATLVFNPATTHAFGNVIVGDTTRKVTTTINYYGSNTATVGTITGLSGAFGFTGGTFPGTGGTCSTAITADCTVEVSFVPTVVGLALSQELRIPYDDGAGNIKNITRTFTGTGVAAASLTISDGPTFTFPTDSFNHASIKTFTVSNIATVTSATGIALNTALNAPFSFPGGFPGGGTCGATLAAGTSCTIKVKFVPTSSALTSDQIRIDYNNGLVPQQVVRPIQGSGTARALLVFDAAPTLAFGSKVVGSVTPADVIVNYFGGLPASGVTSTGLGGAFTFVGGSYPGTGGDCGTSIGAQCKLRVQFVPSSPGAAPATSVRLDYNDGTGSNFATLGFSGTGVAAATLAFTGSPLFNYGSVAIGSSLKKTFTVINNGGSTATGIAITGLGSPFTRTGGSCLTTLAKTITCTLEITFAPTTTGPFGPISMDISYNNGVITDHLIGNPSGTGINSASLAITGSLFGKHFVGSTTQLIYTVTNSGTQAATGMSLAALPAPFSLNTTPSDRCAVTLPAGQNCRLYVQFNPITTGAFSTNLNMSYEGGVTSTALLAISGNGVVPLQMAANGDHTCAITENRQVKCWGSNRNGQLGIGSTVDKLTPASTSAVPLGAGRFPIAIAAGYAFNCAILDNGDVKCWGENTEGQLGIENTNDMGDDAAPLLKVNLGPGRTAKAVTAGTAHTCAIMDDNNVKCWGSNSQGQLGLGNTTPHGGTTGSMGTLPPKIDLGTGLTAVQISANANHTCALLSNQTIKCWGNGFYGQLGLGDSRNRGDQLNQMGNDLPAVDLGGGLTPTAVAVGNGGYTCALLGNGKIKCWGQNIGADPENYDPKGNLGTCWGLDTTGRNIGPCYLPLFPVPTRGIGISPGQLGDQLPFVDLGTRTALSISAGNTHTCAILDDNSARCWGGNSSGELGLGDDRNRGVQDGQMGAALLAIVLGQPATSITAGNFHTCAILNDNTLKCWGDNQFGELGQGGTTNIGTDPSHMPGLAPLVP